MLYLLYKRDTGWWWLLLRRMPHTFALVPVFAHGPYANPAQASDDAEFVANPENGVYIL